MGGEDFSRRMIMTDRQKLLNAFNELGISYYASDSVEIDWWENFLHEHFDCSDRFHFVISSGSAIYFFDIEENYLGQYIEDNERPQGVFEPPKGGVK